MAHSIALVLSYVLGSIPTAYLAGRLAKGIDLRDVGSGNLGFTNAFRVLGWGWSVPVLLVDIAKGMAAIFIAEWMVPGWEWIIVLCGLAAILGHNWTLFLGFKGGGKGVATSAGVFAALTPIPFWIALIIFLIVLVLSRYMSLASLTGAIALSTSSLVFWTMESSYAPSNERLWFVLIASLLVIVRHQSNIKRLVQGTEHTFGHRKEEGDQ